MKRFRFALQTLHDLRAQQCDEAARQLARAAADVAAAAAVLVELEQQRDRAETTLAQARGVLNAHELLLQVGYLEVLGQREHAARGRLAALENARETQRQAALAAARAAEVTEQLRARQLARHQTEAARAEQNLHDELAVTARWRGGQGEGD